MSRITPLLAAASLVVSFCAAAERSETKDEPTPPLAALAPVKKLVGEWVKLDEAGQPTDEVVSSYRVTSGGNAVLGIDFPGTDHEMVTVFHQNGEALILTHYCIVGNHPRMEAVPSETKNSLVFRCVGGINMKSENDRHMHQGTITWIDDNHITSEWLMYENGEHTYTASFRLARKETTRPQSSIKDPNRGTQRTSL